MQISTSNWIINTRFTWGAKACICKSGKEKERWESGKLKLEYSLNDIFSSKYFILSRLSLEMASAKEKKRGGGAEKGQSTNTEAAARLWRSSRASLSPHSIFIGKLTTSKWIQNYNKLKKYIWQTIPQTYISMLLYLITWCGGSRHMRYFELLSHVLMITLMFWIRWLPRILNQSIAGAWCLRDHIRN